MRSSIEAVQSTRVLPWMTSAAAVRLLEVVGDDLERAQLVRSPSVCPHAATCSRSASVEPLHFADRQLKETRAHQTEELGVARRREPVAALAPPVILDPLPGEGLRHLAGGLLRREDERHGAAEHTLEDRADQRIVRAAEDHRVDARVLEGRRVRHARLRPLRPKGSSLSISGTSSGQGTAVIRTPASSVRTSSLVATARHGRLRCEQPDSPVPRRLDGRVRLRRDHADDRNGQALLQVRKRRGGGRVARRDDQLHALALEIRRDLAREAADLLRRPWAVGQARAVADIGEVLVRKGDEALVEDGEPSHARVEHPYRPRVHRSDSTNAHGALPLPRVCAA